MRRTAKSRSPNRAMFAAILLCSINVWVSPACTSATDSVSSVSSDGAATSEGPDGVEGSDDSRDTSLGDLADPFADATCPAVAASSGAGHDDYDGRPYDILNYNCHSAANSGVRKDPARTGILVCGGEPEKGSPAHHTYNYRILDDRTVFYNWGETCESPSTSNPPDVHDDANLSCIAKFCDDQFVGGDQRALAPGELVEEPGPAYCAANTKDRASCDSCCQFRGKYWDLASSDVRPTDRTFAEFMGQCYTTCAMTFR